MEELNFTNKVNKSRIFEIENLEQTNEIALFGRALNAPIRIEILRMLNKKPMLISEIADALNIQLSSASFHLKVLEDAKLVNVDYSTKKKQTLKWYGYAIPKTIVLKMRAEDGIKHNTQTPYTKNISIGDYIDANFAESCGIATEREHIMENEPKQAFIPEKRNAQIIWSKYYGDVTYAIPNDYTDRGKLSEISFSLELCSEAPGYNENYPSDITFWINGIEICTFTSPGDFGDRYGKFTPPWWFTESTKYGLLTNVSIKNQGVYLNEKLVNKKINLQDLNLSNGNKTTFKIGIKENAFHKGGFNIFGENFGDYNQAIIFNAIYENTKQ